MENQLDYVRNQLIARKKELPQIAIATKRSLRSLLYLVAGQDARYQKTIIPLYRYLKRTENKREKS